MATDAKGEVSFHVCVFPITMLFLGNLKTWDGQGPVGFISRQELRNDDVRFLKGNSRRAVRERD